MYIISLYQNFAPDHKEITCTTRKLPCSQTIHFLDLRLDGSPKLSKIRPCDSNFFGVAESGPGIPLTLVCVL